MLLILYLLARFIEGYVVDNKGDTSWNSNSDRLVLDLY